jgi:hypothetical protein
VRRRARARRRRVAVAVGVGVAVDVVRWGVVVRVVVGVGLPDLPGQIDLATWRLVGMRQGVIGFLPRRQVTCRSRRPAPKSMRWALGQAVEVVRGIVVADRADVLIPETGDIDDDLDPAIAAVGWRLPLVSYEEEEPATLDHLYRLLRSHPPRRLIAIHATDALNSMMGITDRLGDAPDLDRDAREGRVWLQLKPDPTVLDDDTIVGQDRRCIGVDDGVRGPAGWVRPVIPRPDPAYV